VTWGRFWLALGLLGQAVFFARFFVQWIASERRKRSVVPLAFWYLSIGGGLILLAYAAYRRDPVFILGQAAGLLIYTRNLILIAHGPQESASSEESAGPESRVG
jgi:lipid-A-disaccharide synthase-like uncharacterized protein